ncbi:MAG: DUF5104 domain-containing protein [Clostridia bacterium]|nr:DUF5104 domain-containing protein [Clostridia bacterium]
MSKFQENFYKGIGTFIATILFFLSTIFPNNKNLMVYRQGRDNSLDTYGPVIVEAVKNKDIATIRDLMCANIKKNTPNLDNRIQEIFNLVEGDFVSTEWGDKYIQGASVSFSRKEGTITQENFLIKIVTTKKTYQYVIAWETINNIKPEETRIRSFVLAEIVLDENNKTKAVNLDGIVATEGVMKWHE